jgi:hypothetical protein
MLCYLIFNNKKYLKIKHVIDETYDIIFNI